MLNPRQPETPNSDQWTKSGVSVHYQSVLDLRAVHFSRNAVFTPKLHLGLDHVPPSIAAVVALDVGDFCIESISRDEDARTGDFEPHR
jgi:hypothetical protein